MELQQLFTVFYCLYVDLIIIHFLQHNSALQAPTRKWDFVIMAISLIPASISFNFMFNECINVHGVLIDKLKLKLNPPASESKLTDNYQIGV